MLLYDDKTIDVFVNKHVMLTLLYKDKSSDRKT